VTTKSECVAQCSTYSTLLCLIESEVKEETTVTEKYDDVERIIAEAEEAAFQLTEETETDSEETKITT
jgi:hypothetical protein